MIFSSLARFDALRRIGAEPERALNRAYGLLEISRQGEVCNQRTGECNRAQGPLASPRPPGGKIRTPLNLLRSRCFPVSVSWPALIVVLSSACTASSDFGERPAVGRGDGSRSRLNSGGVQIACGFQRAGHELSHDVRDRPGLPSAEMNSGFFNSDEAEHPAQIGFQVLADRGRRARAIKAAARDRDDDALVAGQTFDALR